MFKKIIKGFDEQGSHRNALGSALKLLVAEDLPVLPVSVASNERST